MESRHRQFKLLIQGHLVSGRDEFNPSQFGCMWEKVLVAQSCPTFCDPWTVFHHDTLAMVFPRQEYWSG